jgi:hypothetical protein
MKLFRLWTFLLGLFFLSCDDRYSVTSTPDQIEKTPGDNNSADISEIRDLIRQTLTWADSKKSIDLTPMIADNKDSIYIGFDLKRHQDNLKKLIATGFFASEFIEITTKSF